jgi:hypothetical protein
LRDAEPNDDFKLPQQVAALPATVAGWIRGTWNASLSLEAGTNTRGVG